MDAPDEAVLDQLVDRLTLEQKVTMLTGQDSWSLPAVPSIGLRSIVMSDGPAGVRGTSWDERDPSINFPSPTAVAASWDRATVRSIGSGLGSEARRKGVDVVLAPTINLHRTPYGGRHFEAFSEDPLLTAELATQYVQGVQEHGVGATVKHYVANDSETDRFTVDVRVAERALRELYLAAFEGPVVDGPAWLVMSAYNSINGATATENPLLTTPLQDEWAFDGVVVSDWTAVRSIEAARHPQDLAMPGPVGAWGDRLIEAVRSGLVDMAARSTVRSRASLAWPHVSARWRGSPTRDCTRARRWREHRAVGACGGTGRHGPAGQRWDPAPGRAHQHRGHRRRRPCRTHPGRWQRDGHP